MKNRERSYGDTLTAIWFCIMVGVLLLVWLGGALFGAGGAMVAMGLAIVLIVWLVPSWWG